LDFCEFKAVFSCLFSSISISSFFPPKKFFFSSCSAISFSFHPRSSSFSDLYLSVSAKSLRFLSNRTSNSASSYYLSFSLSEHYLVISAILREPFWRVSSRDLICFVNFSCSYLAFSLFFTITEVYSFNNTLWCKSLPYLVNLALSMLSCNILLSFCNILLFSCNILILECKESEFTFFSY